MTAQQGIELVKTVQQQLNGQEREKFNKMVLEQVENFENKVQKCIARLDKKYSKKVNR